MKKIIVAAMLALGSLAATAAPSMADTVIIRDGYGPRHDYRPWHHPRGWERAREVRRHSCRTKTVRVYRDGRYITKTTRVCR